MAHIDTIDRLARSGEAVFAIDARNRIIFWSARCEEMLGRRGEEVLGRPCFDVLCGRDVHGNVFCFRSCAVMHQGRSMPGDPIRAFTLVVPGPNGGARAVQVGTVVLRDARPDRTTIVHVIRKNGNGPPERVRHREPLPVNPDAEADGRNPRERAAELTGREREVLEHLALGSSTATIAMRLGISPITVRNHVQKVLEKLEVHTRAAAVAYAYRFGIVGTRRDATVDDNGVD